MIQQTMRIAGEAAVKPLRDQAPPQRVVVTGTLDEISAKKRTFRLLLPQGQSLRGVLPPGELPTFRQLLGETVVVDGEVSFRLSGRAALISATNIQIATEQDKVFARLPHPRPQSLEDLQPRLRPHTGTNGMSSVFGRWPGEESDEEILAALKELK